MSLWPRHKVHVCCVISSFKPSTKFLHAKHYLVIMIICDILKSHHAELVIGRILGIHIQTKKHIYAHRQAKYFMPFPPFHGGKKNKYLTASCLPVNYAILFIVSVLINNKKEN